MENGWQSASFDSPLFDQMLDELRKEELRKEELRKEELKEKTMKKMLENSRKEQKIFDETNQMRKNLKKQIEVLSLS